MVGRIGGHLTYLSKYAIAFEDSEEVQQVCVILISSYYQYNDHIYQALVAAYCDLLDFYVKVRNLFTHKEGRSSCR